MNANADADLIGARELALYVNNDEHLYTRYAVPTENALRRKWIAGQYKPELAVKSWSYVATHAAKQYSREHGNARQWSKEWPTRTRLLTARTLEQQFRTELEQRHKRNPGTRFYAASTSTESKTRNPDSEDDAMARELDAKLYFQGLAATDWERFQQDQQNGHYDATDAKHYRERMNLALRWLAEK